MPENIAVALSSITGVIRYAGIVIIFIWPVAIKSKLCRFTFAPLYVFIRIFSSTYWLAIQIERINGNGGNEGKILKSSEFTVRSSEIKKTPNTELKAEGRAPNY